MNTRVKVYCYVIIATTLLVLPQYDWEVLWQLDRASLVGACAFVALALLSETLSISGTVGNQRPTSSIAFLPLFACVLLFPPAVAIAAAILTFTPGQVFIHKRPPLRAAFNACQMTLSLAIAIAVYNSLPGHVPQNEQQLLTAAGFASFAVFAVTFFFVNQMFVSIAMALVGVGRVGTVYSRLASANGVNFIYDILVSPIAAVVALLYSHFGVPGLAIVILPLLLIRRSYENNYKLARANKDLLTVLVKTIETRDPYTSGHSIRVSMLARAIAEDLEMGPTMVDRIETTAMVHDVGKIDAVYAPIIRKEGSLTEAERRVIMTHAEQGAEFLKTLESFHPEVIRGVRHHHERFDGTGYPDGLGGAEIPLPARIVMLCDSIDAMLSDRPYRKALSVEQVERELQRCAGTQFDPKIVDIILRKNTLHRAAALVRPDALKHHPHLVKVSA
jgi:putative nucleotidyltransferase with HDIG domain